MQFRSNNSREKILRKFSPQQIEDALGEFYRGPGAKYKDAARAFFKQCPRQAMGEAASEAGGAIAEGAEAVFGSADVLATGAYAGYDLYNYVRSGGRKKGAITSIGDRLGTWLFPPAKGM